MRTDSKKWRPMTTEDETSAASQLTLLIDQTDIAATVRRLARELDRDYSQSPPVLVGVLKGAFIFLADLARQMTVRVHSIEFVRVSSYGANRSTSGEPEIVVGLSPESVAGRDVVVVEDIVDTGLTTARILEYLGSFGLASVRVCTLLHKPSRKRVDVPLDYVGFTIPDHFVVGYGLDFDQRYRELPGVYILCQ